MALTYGAIAAARSGAGAIASSSKSLDTASEDMKNTLRSNGNYQYFRRGTDKGFAVDTDLNTLVSATINTLLPALNRIPSAIEAFCARQEELNRQEEARRQKEMEAAKDDSLGVLTSARTIEHFGKSSVFDNRNTTDFVSRKN